VRSKRYLARLGAGLIGLLVLSAVLAACGSSSSKSSSAATSGGGSSGATTSSSGGGATSTSGGSSSGGKKAKIAAFIVDSANPYDTALSNAEKSEASKLGASIHIFGASNSPSTQVGQCQDAVSSNQYNVFLLKAVAGPPLMSCARQALSQGIKVVAVDDPLGPNYTLSPQVKGVSASILSLPTTNGTALANLTIQACGSQNPCQVAYFFGPPAFVFAAQSHVSFKSVIAKHSSIKLVDEASSNFTSSLGTSLTQQLLTTHPGINVIANDSDQSALGAYKALKSAGKTGSVKVVGGGGSCPGADAIKSGQLFATSALYPATLGSTSVQDGIKALNGQAIAKPELNVAYLSPLGPQITKANVAKFHCEWGTATAAGS
jgi:ABC-type sugar transport system substrate-binding protein